MNDKKWYQRIGPGLITACVVIGPGSIMTSSNVGATYGYSLSWIVLIAVVFMLTYTVLGARLGVVAQESAGSLITQRAGKWLAILIGLSIFFISAAFQFGNNLGVHSAFKVYLGDQPFADYVIVFFNILSLLFLFAFKNLYRALEAMMMVFVGLMLSAFLLNLIAAKPDLVEWGKGFVGIGFPEGKELDLSVVGLIGTTFVIGAAYFQSYLVQQKGWKLGDLKSGMLDARISALIMMTITLMIMTTASSQLRGQKLDGIEKVSNQLEPLFGGGGQLIFCIGVFCAAYSSFLINSMVGGFILSDGLGWGSKPDERGPKMLTACVLLIGMIVAMIAIQLKTKPVVAIVSAQAVTVLAAPLMAGALWWLSNRKDIMGEHRPGVLLNVLAGLGFGILLVIAYHTATAKVLPKIKEALAG